MADYPWTDPHLPVATRRAHLAGALANNAATPWLAQRFPQLTPEDITHLATYLAVTDEPLGEAAEWVATVSPTVLSTAYTWIRLDPSIQPEHRAELAVIATSLGKNTSRYLTRLSSQTTPQTTPLRKQKFDKKELEATAKTYGFNKEGWVAWTYAGRTLNEATHVHSLGLPLAATAEWLNSGRTLNEATHVHSLGLPLAATAEWLNSGRTLNEALTLREARIPVATAVAATAAGIPFNELIAAAHAGIPAAAAVAIAGGNFSVHDALVFLPNPIITGTPPAGMVAWLSSVTLPPGTPAETVHRLSQVVESWKELTEDGRQVPPTLTEAVAAAKATREAPFAADSLFALAFTSTNAAISNYADTFEVYSKSFTCPAPPLPRGQYTSRRLTGQFLSRSDPSGLMLGNATQCCQRIGGVGEASAIHGQTSPVGGFFAVTDDRGVVVAQSWVWCDDDGTWCFDNIETVDKNINATRTADILTVYLAAAEALAHMSNQHVTLGAAYTAKEIKSNLPPTPVRADTTALAYTDANGAQLLLATPPHPTTPGLAPTKKGWKLPGGTEVVLRREWVAGAHYTETTATVTCEGSDTVDDVVAFCAATSGTDSLRVINSDGYTLSQFDTDTPNVTMTHLVGVDTAALACTYGDNAGWALSTAGRDMLGWCDSAEEATTLLEAGYTVPHVEAVREAAPTVTSAQLARWAAAGTNLEDVAGALRARTDLTLVDAVASQGYTAPVAYTAAVFEALGDITATTSIVTAVADNHEYLADVPRVTPRALTAENVVTIVQAGGGGDLLGAAELHAMYSIDIATITNWATQQVHMSGAAAVLGAGGDIALVGELAATGARLHPAAAALTASNRETVLTLAEEGVFNTDNFDVELALSSGWSIPHIVGYHERRVPLAVAVELESLGVHPGQVCALHEVGALYSSWIADAVTKFSLNNIISAHKLGLSAADLRHVTPHMVGELVDTGTTSAQLRNLSSNYLTKWQDGAPLIDVLTAAEQEEVKSRSLSLKVTNQRRPQKSGWDDWNTRDDVLVISR